MPQWKILAKFKAHEICRIERVKINVSTDILVLKVVALIRIEI